MLSFGNNWMFDEAIKFEYHKLVPIFVLFLIDYHLNLDSRD